MENSKNSNRWKKFVVFIVVLLVAIIFIYASLRTTPSPQSAPAKSKSTSQEATAKNKSGSQGSSDTPAATRSTPPSSSNSPNGTTSQNLADTGPGDAAVLFLFTAIFSYVLHRSYLKRTLL